MAELDAFREKVEIIFNEVIKIHNLSVLVQNRQVRLYNGKCLVKLWCIMQEVGCMVSQSDDYTQDVMVEQLYNYFNVNNPVYIFEHLDDSWPDEEEQLCKYALMLSKMPQVLQGDFSWRKDFFRWVNSFG